MKKNLFSFAILVCLSFALSSDFAEPTEKVYAGFDLFAVSNNAP